MRAQFHGWFKRFVCGMFLQLMELMKPVASVRWDDAESVVVVRLYAEWLWFFVSWSLYPRISEGE